jgi:dipeptidyl aminopeptidase/acylaminoacyl peptidase
LSGDQIGWMGESWGGSTVLQAGASTEDVAFIIAESSFQDWDSAVFERAKIWYGSWIVIMRPAVWAIVALRTGVDYETVSPLLKAKDITEPVLVLHSQSDTETAPVQSDHIAAALPANHSRLHNLDWGARHGNNVFARPQEYRELLFDFIHDFAPEWDAYLKCE